MIFLSEKVGGKDRCIPNQITSKIFKKSPKRGQQTNYYTSNSKQVENLE